MAPQTEKHRFMQGIIVFSVIASFIFTLRPVSLSAHTADQSHLNAPPVTDSKDPGKTGIVKELRGDQADGGNHNDLHSKAKAIIADKATLGPFYVYEYDPKTKGYTKPEKITKKQLQKLYANDMIGPIPLAENLVGTIDTATTQDGFIWARKQDGAVVTKSGDLFISGRLTFPTMFDTPMNRIDLPKYVKIAPLGYNFFKTYLGKGVEGEINGEYAWIADILADAHIVLVTSESLGARHFSVDKTNKTIKIEKEFMDYLLHAGMKRPGMGLFAEAAIELSETPIPADKAREVVDKIARKSLTGKNRLENAIDAFNLAKKIAVEQRKLTPQERQFFLIDYMERNRQFNGRRAAELMTKKFGYYGQVTPAVAEQDLRTIVKNNPGKIFIQPYEEKPEHKIIKYLDRTDTFWIEGKYLADTDLLKNRLIVFDHEVDAPDGPYFGGKTAYTGMMQWAPHASTLPMFATSGDCFTDLINFNNLKPEFERYAKELVDRLDELERLYGKKSPEYSQGYDEITKATEKKFKDKLEWETARVMPELKKEITESLKVLARTTGQSVFDLILAIRSSAVGEDSETASFAGRQDTSLFVAIMTELLLKMDLQPEDFGYTAEELKTNFFAWYDILNQAKAKLGQREVDDTMLDVYVKEWLANQRSLFNKRAIDYRLELNAPIFTDKVKMSSLFQIQANTEFGFVAFSINRATGNRGVSSVEVIEGQTNPLVDGSATGDLVFVSKLKGRFHSIMVPEQGRKAIHLPSVFGPEVLGRILGTAAVEGKGPEMKKGGVIQLNFPDELRGTKAITDTALLAKMGESIASLADFFELDSDIEGGLIVRRDEKGNVVFYKDKNEPDGFSKDASGKKRMSVYHFYTQIRPDAKFNAMNPDVIEQHWNEIPDDEIKRAETEGKILYKMAQAKTQGAVSGQVFIVDKEKPETWHRTLKKIMVTHQSDPDMNKAMLDSLGVIAAVGGRNSHTMIVAIEHGLIAISGIGDINKFYNGQWVTIDASRGMVLEGKDWKMFPAGNDYNIRELGVLPQGFKLGLNVNSADLSQQAAPLRNKPDFYGIGLLRLEFLLEMVGAAGEGFLRYDSYKIQNLLETLDRGKLSPADRNLLNRIFHIKGKIRHLNARINDNFDIVVTIDRKDQIVQSGKEFYNRFIRDDQYPPYDLKIPEEAALIKEFDKKTESFVIGEERYKEIMSTGIQNIVEPLMVDPLEILIYAQKIDSKRVKARALVIAEEYARTFLEADGALPTDELIEYVNDLIKKAEGRISKKDSAQLYLMKMALSIAFYIRLDDRKSDEYETVLGSTVKRDRNAMIGDRGIKLMLDNIPVTQMQLAAIRRVVDIGSRIDDKGFHVGKGKYRMRIFSPIVYDPEHVARMNKLFDEAGLTADRVDRGIMTETPQSAELIPFLLAQIVFSSTGGNDMLQMLHEVDRQNAAPYFNSITSRSIQSIRVLATIANVTKEWNEKIAIPLGLKLVTCGYCGNWPADDPVGALVLYILGYDSASITVPSMDRTNNDLYGLLDHLFGHDENGLLLVPGDKEEVVKALYALIADTANQKGLSQRIIDMLPVLKVALDNRHFNIYKQIDLNAQPDIRINYAKGSISQFHLSLPFHYQLLAAYDKDELEVAETTAELKKQKARLEKVLKGLEADRDAVVKAAEEKNEDPDENIIGGLAAKIKETEDGIALAEFKIQSIKLKAQVESFLKAQGQNIYEDQAGQRYYIQSLKNTLKDAAQQAKDKGELFIIETSKEPADYRKAKPGGDRYELPKEPNPDIGNRGMKRVLNPDRNIFAWELQAIAEMRAEGLTNIALAFSKVREVTEIDDARTMIKEAGLEGMPLGLVNNSPNIIYAFDQYLDQERGVSFIFMDREAMRELAEAKRGTEWDNVNTVLITDQDVDRSLKDVSIPATKTAAEKYNKALYLAEEPGKAVKTDTVPPMIAIPAPSMVSPLVIPRATEKPHVEADGGNIVALDENAFKRTQPGYENLMNALENSDNGEIVFGAHTFFENPGLIRAVEEMFLVPSNGVRVAVWGLEDDMRTLKDMRVDAHERETSLERILAKIDPDLIKDGRVVLVVSDGDLKNINKEYGKDADKFFKDNSKIKVVRVQSPVIKDAEVKLANSPTDIIGAAVAAIFPDLTGDFKLMLRERVRSERMSSEAADSIVSSLDKQIIDMPRVVITEDEAEEVEQYQTAVDEMMPKA